jgi:hypothetical protein
MNSQYRGGSVRSLHLSLRSGQNLSNVIGDHFIQGKNGAKYLVLNQGTPGLKGAVPRFHQERCFRYAPVPKTLFFCDTELNLIYTGAFSVQEEYNSQKFDKSISSLFVGIKFK